MMGGGAGHIADMIGRLKANEAMRKRRKRYFTVMEPYLKPNRRKPTPDKPLSAMQRKRILVEIRQYKRAQDIKVMKMFAVSVVLTVLLLAFLWTYFSRSF